jgi:hypothetical protein
MQTKGDLNYMTSPSLVDFFKSEHTFLITLLTKENNNYDGFNRLEIQ